MIATTETGRTRPHSEGRIAVTVAIPIKNEAANLSTCLAAVQDFDQLVVIDSNSTDNSLEIATKFGAETLNFEWDGHFPKKRNWFLQNGNIRNDWVLFLDADEIVTPAFTEELRKTLPSAVEAGFWIEYSNYFLNKPLQHGLPQRKLALFRKDAGQYERIDEQRWSQLDMEVHEHPQLRGQVGSLAARIDHRDMQGLEKFLLRHIDYAKWEAARVQASRTKIAQGDPNFTRRQKMKYQNISRFWFPFAYFCYTYFIRAGFIDGRVGLTYAFYKFWYFETIRQLLKS